MKIVCDDKIPFLKGLLEPFARVVYMAAAAIDKDALRDADVLVIRTRTICNERLLGGTRVKLIVTATIGYDHIDTLWCTAHGIEWRNCAGCNAGSVEQYMASVLALLSQAKGFAFGERTLGVVGVGHVGSRVARMARTLGMRVLLNDPPRSRAEGSDGFVGLEQLMAQSDIITLHPPLIRGGDESTYHLFDTERLTKLRPEQILINASRGPVVDNTALKKLLLRGGLAAAVLDVWENEPLIDRELLGLLFAGTPHIAGYSADGKACGTMMAVRAIGGFYGLPCAHCEIDELPVPRQTTDFWLDGGHLSWEQVVRRAILHTYDVTDDSKRLTDDVDSFENQRSNYPVRREFAAFTLHTKNMPEEWRSRLRSLGFNVVVE